MTPNPSSNAALGVWLRGLDVASGTGCPQAKPYSYLNYSPQLNPR